MEQKLVRFVKFHGFKLAFISLESAYVWGRSVEEALGKFAMEAPLPFGYEPFLVVVWLLPLLWTTQGVLLIVGVIRGYPSCMRLLSLMSIVTFLLELSLFLVLHSLDLLTITKGIIYLAYDILCTFYVLRTLEQMFEDLEQKRQEAVVINTIVCEDDGGAQSKQNSEQNHPLPVRYVIRAIRALRRLFRGWDKKSRKVGSAEKPIAEPEPISATELASQYLPWE